MATPESNPREIEIADLHAVGELIYQLVRRAEGSGIASWPLRMSPEWSSIFRQKAEDWLKLCDDLLDPTDSRIRTMTLEDLEVKLIELEPKSTISTRAAVSACAAISVAAILSYLYFGSGGKTVKPGEASTGLKQPANDARLARIEKRLEDWEVFFRLKSPSGTNSQPLKLTEPSVTTKGWLLKEVKKMESAYKNAGGRLSDQDFENRIARLQKKISSTQEW